MALIAAPDWLTKRDGSLKPGLRPEVVVVMLGGQPQYRLDCRPAGGQFMCGVTQSNNGCRLDDPATKYPTADGALAGGLDQLRAKLGW